MLDPILRPLKDRLLAPLAQLLAPHVHPTAITFASFVAGVGCAWLLLLGETGGAVLLWLVNRALDGLDGVVARNAGRQTDLGGYVDLLVDFVVYAAIPIALSIRWPEGAGLPLAALLAAFYVNSASWLYLAALLEKRAVGSAFRGDTTSITMPTGLVEGTETIIFFSAFMLLPERLSTLFSIMAAMLAITILQRLAWASRNLDRAPALGVVAGRTESETYRSEAR